MPKQVRLVQVFVASPSDMTEERQAVRQVIEEVNRILAKKNVRLEFVGWETHVDPGTASHPQQVINQQIGTDYDIFLGMMWTRFGTPTAAAGSGTEEEFKRAFESLHRPKAIKFYFKDKPISPALIDPSQMALVQSFRSKLGSEHGAFYATFSELTEFESLIRIDLARFASEQPALGLPRTMPTPAQGISDDVLANLNSIAESEDSDIGFLEAIDNSNRSMIDLGKVLTRITEATQRLVAAIDRAGKQLSELKTLSPKGVDPVTAKIIIDNIAIEMNAFVESISHDIVSFHMLYGEFSSSYDAALEFMEENREAVEDLSQFSEQADVLDFFADSINNGLGDVVVFVDSIKSLPRISSDFNKAKRRCAAVSTDLLNVFEKSATKARELGAKMRHVAR